MIHMDHVFEVKTGCPAKEYPELQQLFARTTGHPYTDFDYMWLEWIDLVHLWQDLGKTLCWQIAQATLRPPCCRRFVLYWLSCASPPGLTHEELLIITSRSSATVFAPGAVFAASPATESRRWGLLARETGSEAVAAQVAQAR